MSTTTRQGTLIAREGHTNLVTEQRDLIRIVVLYQSKSIQTKKSIDFPKIHKITMFTFKHDSENLSDAIGITKTIPEPLKTFYVNFNSSTLILMHTNHSQSKSWCYALCSYKSVSTYLKLTYVQLSAKTLTSDIRTIITYDRSNVQPLPTIIEN